MVITINKRIENCVIQGGGLSWNLLPVGFLERKEGRRGRG